MIYKATRLIAQALDEEGIRYEVKENEKYSEAIVSFPIKNGPSARVSFISSDDDNDVTVRIFGLVHDVSEDRDVEILKAINKCNDHFRFAKMVMDEDRDINVEYDFPVKTGSDCVGEIACELASRLSSILEDCYPILMKALWG